MSRARIAALALVNWKGVFYERYELDRAVTALEGANGAGKTTVMIAAYVALFPEIARLRFTNLGEHEATKGDRGIYGRLGREGWPSLTVLDIRYGRGERVLAGVKLERRNDPVVELEPFLVRGLGEDVRLQDVLLDVRQERERAVDRLPDKPLLVQRVARAGGTLRWLEPRAYFRELFDLGLTPLRLDAEEERARFNEMLRTSMIGGISRTLSGGLREFVLREDAHLVESLRAMRENLAACQATRRQVEESGAAQREIADVYVAAERMFTRAVHAARVRAEEQAELVLAARTREDEAALAARTAAERRAAARAAVARAGETEAEATERETQAKEWATRIERAVGLLRARRAAEHTRDDLDGRHQRARDAEALAAQTLLSARDAREVTIADRDRLAHALADSRAAWAELSRRAGLYEDATKRHDRLLATIGERARTREAFLTLAAERRASVERLDAQLAASRRVVAGAEAARRDFNEVATALGQVLTELAGIGEAAPGPVPPDEAWERAQAAEAVLRDLRAFARERESLGQQVRDATRRAERWRSLGQALAALGVEAKSATELVRTAQEAREEHERRRAASTTAAHTHTVTRASLATARTRIATLEEERPRWQAVQGRARALAARIPLPVDAAGLATLEERLRAEEHHIRTQGAAAAARARDARAEADRLASAEGGLAPDLVDACDVVEGELVVRRYDDVPLDEAAATEALLGPLRNGILVRDPRAAADRLLAHGALPEEVWLVGALPEALPGERHPLGVVVREGAALRVTRSSDRPALGSAARRRRVDELRATAATDTADAERLVRTANTLAESVARLRELAGEATRWLAPDPGIELDRARREAGDLDRAVEEARVTLDAATAAATAATDREARITRLLPDAHLLDAPDPEAERDAYRARLDRALRVAPALEKCQSAAAVLERRLVVLRSLPPSVAEVAELRTQERSLEAERDREDRAARDLDWLVEHGEALAWVDAPARLRDANAGEASLRADHERATRAAEGAERSCKEAETTADDARAALVDARGRLDRAKEDVARLADELSQLGVGEPGAEDLARSVAEANAASRAVGEARRALDAAKEHQVRADIAAEQADKTAADARDALARAELQARPAQDAWTAIAAEIDTRGYGGVVFAEAVVAAVRSSASSIQLSQQARHAQAELGVHLSHATRATSVLATLEAPTDDLRWEHYVRAWEAVRAWVRERVPANVSETDDPVAALADLGRHLAGLRATLLRQEEQLRGSSKSVADHIGQSLRRARTLLQRLNADLDTVRFGSIQRVEVQALTRPEMNRLLDALRGEQAQGALFQTGVTLEDALAAIYLRETGGRIAGQKLLDYREYLDLHVRVRREGSAEWEAANATRMSTGEAIGVGAALMMVVLTAWERRETVGRAARKHGSLRFLFLDEANRLSQDNLKTLFELCDNLELQLLVAAPEVAQSEGNITYRLVRRLVNGEPVVDVTGRRTEA